MAPVVAVVAGEPDLARAGEILGKAQKALAPGPPEAVDGLVRVTDGGDRGSFDQQMLEQAHLGRVAVLVLVHQHMIKAPAPGLGQGRVIFQGQSRPAHQVVQIQAPRWARALS